MKEIEFTIETSGERLDKALSELMPEHSRSSIQRMIKEEQVLVNGELSKARYTVKTNDIIHITIPDATSVDIKPVEMPLDIVYEDKDIIVINKAKGMVVHPSAGHQEDTLVNAVLYHCGKDLSGINGEIRPGIVHRIDKDTTGLLVICKNDYAHEFIAKQLQAHTVTRTYEAIAYYNFKDEEGTVEAPITHYEVLERLDHKKFTHIRCRLETGRTHQIRVHMASIMHPLLGDDIYGPTNTKFNLQGQCLHAKTLGFIHPSTKEYIAFDSELPDYFKTLLAQLRDRG
jgi:23S rRNA pseudouridine1911/1915/1917 synthase